MTKRTLFLCSLISAVLVFGLFSCKQESDDTEVNVYTDEKYYTYYYKASDGSVNYAYDYTSGSSSYERTASAPLTDGVVKVYWTSYTNSNFICYNLETDISFTYIASYNSYSGYSYNTQELGEISIYKVGNRFYLDSIDGKDVTNYVSGLGDSSIQFTKMPCGDDFYLTLTLTRY